MIRKTLFFILLMAAWVKPLGLLAEAPQAVDPYELEAAYLVHFLEFVDWPAHSFADVQSPYVVGILGDDPFGDRLDRLTVRRLFNARSVVIKRFGSFDPSEVEAMRGCHILYVAESEKERLTAILKSVRKFPVLTVSEIDKFPLFGGILGFDQEGKKIRLFVNLKAVKTAKLQFSARLLQVCRTYGEE